MSKSNLRPIVEPGRAVQAAPRVQAMAECSCPCTGKDSAAALTTAHTQING